MELTSEDPRGYAIQFREAFLEGSAKVLPGVVWGEPSVCEAEYSRRSPVLGLLTVAFEADQITVYCGRHHAHFTLYEGDIRDGAHKIPAEALGFVRDLTSDAVVVRWASYGSWTVRARRSTGGLGRLWRFMTPWVHEGVWSGAKIA
jgi:hypothetical protein